METSLTRGLPLFISRCPINMVIGQGARLVVESGDHDTAVLFIIATVAFITVESRIRTFRRFVTF